MSHHLTTHLFTSQSNHISSWHNLRVDSSIPQCMYICRVPPIQSSFCAAKTVTKTTKYRHVMVYPQPHKPTAIGKEKWNMTPSISSLSTELKLLFKERAQASSKSREIDCSETCRSEYWHHERCADYRFEGRKAGGSIMNDRTAAIFKTSQLALEGVLGTSLVDIVKEGKRRRRRRENYIYGQGCGKKRKAELVRKEI